jgi:hypothetical protein
MLLDYSLGLGELEVAPALSQTYENEIHMSKFSHTSGQITENVENGKGPAGPSPNN